MFFYYYILSFLSEFSSVLAF